MTNIVINWMTFLPSAWNKSPSSCEEVQLLVTEFWLLGLCFVAERHQAASKQSWTIHALQVPKVVKQGDEGKSIFPESAGILMHDWLMLLLCCANFFISYIFHTLESTKKLLLDGFTLICFDGFLSFYISKSSIISLLTDCIDEKLAGFVLFHSFDPNKHYFISVHYFYFVGLFLNLSCFSLCVFLGKYCYH